MCELCQQKFPEYAGGKDERYKLFEYEEPVSERVPFIVFKSIYTIKSFKTYHVVQVKHKKDTRIVRGLVSV